MLIMVKKDRAKFFTLLSPQTGPTGEKELQRKGRRTQRDERKWNQGKESTTFQEGLKQLELFWPKGEVCLPAVPRLHKRRKQRHVLKCSKRD